MQPSYEIMYTTLGSKRPLYIQYLQIDIISPTSAHTLLLYVPSKVLKCSSGSLSMFATVGVGSMQQSGQCAFFY